MLLIRLVPVTLVMGTIFFLSHQSGDSLPLPEVPGLDKVAHLLAYATLSLTVLWFLGRSGAKRPNRAAWQTVGFCLLYGLTDEFHQSFIAARSVSSLDLLADVAGAGLAALHWYRRPQLRLWLLSWQQTLAIRLRLFYNE